MLEIWWRLEIWNSEEQKHTATKKLDPGLYLTEHIFAFMSMLRTLASCFVHQILTWKHMMRLLINNLIWATWEFHMGLARALKCHILNGFSRMNFTPSRIPCSHHFRTQALKDRCMKNQRSKLAFHAPHIPSYSGKRRALLYSMWTNVAGAAEVCRLANILMTIFHYLTSIYIPNRYYPLVVATSNMVFSVHIPAQATKFGSWGYLHNRTVDIGWFVNQLKVITLELLNKSIN